MARVERCALTVSTSVAIVSVLTAATVWSTSKCAVVVDCLNPVFNSLLIVYSKWSSATQCCLEQWQLHF